VAARFPVAQRASARRGQSGVAGAPMGRRCRSGRLVRAVDDRRGLHDRAGVRPGQAGRRVRLHQDPRLPPAAGDLRRDRAGAVQSAAGRGGWRGAGREELPDRDVQPGPGGRRDRGVDAARRLGVLLQGGAAHRAQVPRPVLDHRPGATRRSGPRSRRSKSRRGRRSRTGCPARWSPAPMSPRPATPPSPAPSTR
jgi:hypothetical protein